MATRSTIVAVLGGREGSGVADETMTVVATIDVTSLRDGRLGFEVELDLAIVARSLPGRTSDGGPE